MRKVLLSVTIISLLFAVSCENQNYYSSIGNWVFKGVTYNALTTQVSGNMLTAANASDSAQLSFKFSSFPIVAGAYRVVSPADSSPGNHVSIQIAVAGGAPVYVSTGNDNVTAAVNVSAFKKVSISLSGAEMVNNANAADSASATYLFVNQQ